MKAIGTLLLLLLIISPAFAETVYVSAAASMTDALREIASTYAVDHADTAVRLNVAGSGTLARQIAQGAPGDLYISANPRWMDYLVEEGLVARDGVKDLARNALVFIGRPGSTVSSMEDLLRLSHIALGSPTSVPAGQYAATAMQKAGIYTKMVSAGKLVMAKDVRQALVYADRGEVDGAFVYRTDAPLAQRTKVLFEVPTDLYPPVIYPAALTDAGKSNPKAVSFFQYLFSRRAQEILQRFGFLTAEDSE